MGLPRVAFELPMEDRRLLESARNAQVRGVLLGDGHAERALSGGSDEFSVTALALDVGQRLLIAAESVDVGPKAEAFRVRVFSENASFSTAMQGSLRSPESCPPELDLAALSRGVLQPGVLRFKNSMTVEIVPGTESRIDLISDGALIFLGSSGAIFLVEHDHEIPLNLRITTSSKVIERVVSRALEVVLL